MKISGIKSIELPWLFMPSVRWTSVASSQLILELVSFCSQIGLVNGWCHNVVKLAKFILIVSYWSRFPVSSLNEKDGSATSCWFAVWLIVFSRWFMDHWAAEVGQLHTGLMDGQREISHLFFCADSSYSFRFSVLEDQKSLLICWMMTREHWRVACTLCFLVPFSCGSWNTYSCHKFELVPIVPQYSWCDHNQINRFSLCNIINSRLLLIMFVIWRMLSRFLLSVCRIWDYKVFHRVVINHVTCLSYSIVMKSVGTLESILQRDVIVDVQNCLKRQVYPECIAQSFHWCGVWKVDFGNQPFESFHETMFPSFAPCDIFHKSWAEAHCRINIE